ncbi:MAG: flavin reductase family protein [Arenicella sp.]
MINNSVPLIKPQLLSLKLHSRHQETTNIVSFDWEVRTEDGTPFRHYPGQAVSLSFVYKGENAIRTFTIASPPSDNNRIVLTIKAGVNAKTTRYMHENWGAGTTISARGPFGKFSLIHTPKTPLLLIGAGSGITPMLSMINWLFERNEQQTDIVFLQQAATPNDLLCQSQLNNIDAAMPNVVQINCVTTVPYGEAWSGFRGLLSRASLNTLVPDIAKRTIFCCGPEGFNTLIRKIYLAQGGSAEKFLTESFGAKKADITVSKNTKQVLDNNALTVDLDGHIFNNLHGKTIVESAASNGIKIPTGCQEGYCGTCKLKLKSGSVNMQHNGGISSTEEEDGYILACSSHATSNLEVTRNY